MPSVCKNSEKVNVAENEASLTPYKACISALDKKLRNLEKRKGKLDSYREKLAKGEKLDKDQKESVAKYESVIANLEFARELHKLYQSMSDEADKLAEKASKKQAKKEKLERQQQEFDRLSDVLKLQSVMLSVGNDEVRSDLLAGKFGGFKLTEQNLEQLDEFYQLISPANEGETSFVTLLSAATEHLILYIERSEKQVVGTTYGELHKLSDLLANSGLLDGGNVPETGITAAELTEQAETSEELCEAPKAEDTPGRELAEDEISSTVDTVELTEQGPEGSYEAISLPEVASLTSSSTNVLQQPAVDATGMTWYQSPADVTKAGGLPSINAMADNIRYQRPLQEIVSSLQGSYNFLQDSEIDADQSFERVNFMAKQDHSYTFVNQQMSLQHAGPDVGKYSATTAPGTQVNGGFVSAHHHQVALQEPGFVVVGHDPASGEMQYAYAGNQSALLASVSVPESSGKRVGGGDAQLHEAVPVLSAASHQGFDATGGHGVVYGSGRGGNRGGTVYTGRGGPSRTGGSGVTDSSRGGKSR